MPSGLRTVHDGRFPGEERRLVRSLFGEGSLNLFEHDFSGDLLRSLLMFMCASYLSNKVRVSKRSTSGTRSALKNLRDTCKSEGEALCAVIWRIMQEVRIVR
jgi:hypothetical protein